MLAEAAGAPRREAPRILLRGVEEYISKTSHEREIA